MIARHLIFLFLSFFYVEQCFPQEQNNGFENYKNFTVEQGLPSNQINCFSKDKDGFMWIGTNKGLVRFDGSKVVLYQNDALDSTSISGNNIICISIEGDSLMWVGTATKGLNKFSFKTQKFKRYLPDPAIKGSIPSEEVIALEHDEFGQLWIGFHRAGMAKYNQKDDNFTKIELPEFEGNNYTRQNNIVKKFLFDKENKNLVWIFTLQDLIRYDDKTGVFKVYSHNDVNNDPKNLINTIGYGIKASDGKFYIPCSRKGVLVFDPISETWNNYNEKEYNPLNRNDNNFNLIEQKDPTTFWLGSRAKGIWVLDTKKGYILPLDSCDGKKTDQLCNLSITCIDLNAKEGHWIGSTSGLRLYSKIGNQFSTYSHHPTKENLKNRANITAILQLDSNGIYYGGYAGEGIYYYDLKTKTKSLILPPYKYRAGIVHEMFFTRKILPYNDSTLIVLSDNALFKLHTKNKLLEEINTGLIYKKDFFYLNRIFEHSDGSFYISTRHAGIFHLDSNFKLFEHLDHKDDDPNSLISSNYIYEITEDPLKNVWIGTEDGFSVFDPNTSSFLNFDYKERVDSIPVLKIIFSIKLAPDSSLWFIDSRANGVFLNYPYTKPYQFHPIITGKNGQKERLKNILFSYDGKTVLATENGLSIKYNSGKIIRYNKKQGLPDLSSLGPIEELYDGKIAIGSGKTLILFHPDSLIDYPKDLSTYLASISVFNKEYDVDLNEVMKKGLVLSYLQNFFSIDIGIINFNNPEEYTLKYRLKGLNDQWFTDKERKAVFTHIPGGKYQFEAWILDKDLQELNQCLSFPIEIIPPFWETLWFKIGGFSLFVLIGLAFYLIRIRSIKREAQLKTEFNKQIANMELSALRAQMNPHFLFNSLNSIRNNIINNKPEKADKYLVKFSRLVRQVLQNSREQLINLKDEMETLNLYVDLESSRFDHRFTYELTIEEDLKIEELRIPPLILQPYIENAIWHGLMQKEDEGKVSVRISIRNESLNIVIEDDGVGREKALELKSKTATEKESMGMEITGNRLEIIEKIYQLSCNAKIEDLKNQEGEALGTRVTLTLPLIYET